MAKDTNKNNTPWDRMNERMTAYWVASTEGCKLTVGDKYLILRFTTYNLAGKSGS